MESLTNLLHYVNLKYPNCRQKFKFNYIRHTLLVYDFFFISYVTEVHLKRLYNDFNQYLYICVYVFVHYKQED